MIYNKHMSKQSATNNLTSRRKSELDRAVKKTVRQYRKTLNLLSRT